MESVFGRYRNLIILVGVLFLQALGLAVQVKRNVENEPTRLIRIWAVGAVTPFEKGIVWIQSGSANLWHNYFYLRGVRQENRDLKAEIQKLRLEQVRLNDDAEQAHRLQSLLAFKEQFMSQTTAAQVIGSSGSQQSRVVYIDKGSDDGLKPDMAVITADGVVGKLLRVFGSTSQVLLIDDQSSGVGAILEKSRLQGVLRGTPAGEVVLQEVMSDETVQAGEKVLTSGGDQIFPKGLPVGVVSDVSRGHDFFLNIRVKPAANLSKLEEVLVVTKVEDKTPPVEQAGPTRAIDVLTQRLPFVPEKPAVDPAKPAASTAAGPNQAATKPNAKPGEAAMAKPGVPGNKANSAAASTLAEGQVKPPVAGSTSAKPQVGAGAAATTSAAAGMGQSTNSAGTSSAPAKPVTKPVSAQKALAPGAAPSTHPVVNSTNPAPAKPKTQPQAPPQNPPPAPEGPPQ